MAGLQLFGRKKDRETQKGERWLKERRVVFAFVDLEQKAPSPGERDSVARAAGGLDALIDTAGSAFQKGGWSHRVYDAADLLLEHPELWKTPILRKGPSAVIGFDEKAWKALADSP